MILDSRGQAETFWRIKGRYHRPHMYGYVLPDGRVACYWQHPLGIGPCDILWDAD